jgi:acyl carrier protein
MDDNIRTELKEFILKEFLPGEDLRDLTDDLPLISGGILDSIATLKLILHLEERYRITLEAHEADKSHLDTIDRIAGLVEAKVKSRAS